MATIKKEYESEFDNGMPEILQDNILATACDVKREIKVYKSTCSGTEGDEDDIKNMLMKKDSEIIALQNKLASLQADIIEKDAYLIETMQKLGNLNEILNENQILLDKLAKSNEKLKTLQEQKLNVINVKQEDRVGEYNENYTKYEEALETSFPTIKAERKDQSNSDVEVSEFQNDDSQLSCEEDRSEISPLNNSMECNLSSRMSPISSCECNGYKQQQLLSDHKNTAEYSNVCALHKKPHPSIMKKDQQTFSCHICQKSFAYISSLRRHKFLHKEERPFSCAFCCKTFKTSQVFKVHERIHIGHRPYSCNFCGKSFIQHSALKRHELLHTNERPYPCDNCNKSFKSKIVLTLHQRTHTGERPYPCNICSKSFSRFSILKIHVRSHTGERPYSCDLCNKTFADQSGFRKHALKHHSERT